jgi:hypothetical protein
MRADADRAWGATAWKAASTLGGRLRGKEMLTKKDADWMSRFR